MSKHMTPADWEAVEPLYPYEFDSPDQPGTHQYMRADFVYKLKKARDIAGIPFIFNSGIRTEQHNKKVGGKEDSSHLLENGCAADISCSNSRQRFIILSALLTVGFTRIGIGSTFIHVDNDPAKAGDVVWTY